MEHRDPKNQLRECVWEKWKGHISLSSPSAMDWPWVVPLLSLSLNLLICKLGIIKVLVPHLYGSTGELKIEMICQSLLPILNHQTVDALVFVDTNAQSNFVAKETKTEEKA